MLDREREYFQRNRRRWVAQGKEGSYVILCGSELGGFYPSLSRGLLAGMKRWAPSLFLVREVKDERSGWPFDLLVAEPFELSGTALAA